MIKEKIKNIKNIIGSKKLIIVSKNRSINEILDAYNVGHRDFGENKVQEAKSKWFEPKKINSELKLHMVGKLQSNKANIWRFYS